MKRARVARLAVVAVVWPAATAGVVRGLAPTGASHNWLPDEQWVHRRWIPFDERVLNVKLGFGPHERRAYRDSLRPSPHHDDG